MAKDVVIRAEGLGKRRNRKSKKKGIKSRRINYEINY